MGQNTSFGGLPLSAGALFQLSAVVSVLWLGYIAIYRLYLSPIAKFPGPKLAALTGAYEGYYDCLKDGGGRYYVEINRMHDKYGPIVRINPWELHVRDPDWADIYKVTRRTHKPERYYCFLGTVGNTFTSGPAEVHRMRRDALQPYFSAAAVARHVPHVEQLVGKLCNRLRAFRGKSELVNVGDVFRCLATDVATAFAFREPFGHLDSPDFEHAGNSAVRKFGHLGLLNRQLGGKLVPAMKKIPRSIAIKLNPASLGVAGFYKHLGVIIERELGTKRAKATGDEAEDNVIHQILSSKLPPPEKAPWRVAMECSSITLAGTETSGGLLATTSFLLLANPGKLERLEKELDDVERTLGRKPTYQELRDLPYLTAVINEAMRLESGVSARLPRLDPKQDIVYKDWVIPKGTPISTTQNDTNFNADIFPSPHAFQPERWLADADRKRLGRYLYNFGRGTRSCIGMEVAYVEIYLALGRIFAPSSGFRLELYDTDYERDVAMFHDYFSPFPKSTNGIRAFVV